MAKPAMRPIALDIPRPDMIDPGPAPMLQWIDIDKLVVDETYQREFAKGNVAAATRIAERFDWRKFSTVHVAPIEGGLFAVIDGQHRTHAAAACGFSAVPCQVTPMSRREQASAFSAINGAATAVTSLQIFRAAVAADEAWAIQVRDTCAAAGCTAMTANSTAKAKEAGEIYAVMLIRKMIKAYGIQRMTAALTIIRQAGKTAEDPATWALGFLKPLVSALITRPHVMADPAGASRIVASLNLWRLQDKADLLNRDRRDKGLVPLQRVDALESEIGDAMDKVMSTKSGR